MTIDWNKPVWTVGSHLKVDVFHKNSPGVKEDLLLVIHDDYRGEYFHDSSEDSCSLYKFENVPGYPLVYFDGVLARVKDLVLFYNLLPKNIDPPLVLEANDDEILLKFVRPDSSVIISFEGDGGFSYGIKNGEGSYFPGKYAGNLQGKTLPQDLLENITGKV